MYAVEENVIIEEVQEDVAIWTDDATKLLIQLYKEKKLMVEERKIKTMKKMWENIQAEMNCYGYLHTLTQCENKWKSLERAFKNKMLNKKKTGRGRKSCPFERELEDIFSKRHSVYPVCTLNSTEINLPEISPGHDSELTDSESILEPPLKKPKKSESPSELKKIRILQEKILDQKLEAQKQRQELLDILKKRNEILETMLQK